jgi:pro-kumamolisin-like protein/Big-like domain-containing protein
MKKNSTIFLKNCLLTFAILFAFAGSPGAAQTKSNGALAAQVAPVPARITQVIDETKLVTLKGNVHPLARAEFDQGAVSDAMPATRMLLLLQRSAEQETTLRQLLDQQQDKASPNYHAWLTPQQFAKQFGPADADIQAMTGWLESHGFQNVKAGAGRTTIEFSGNVGQLRSAFHTDFHQFLVHGEQHFANVSDPQIPAALAPVIAGVGGLHNFRPKSQMRRATNFQKAQAKVVRTKPSVTFTGCGASGNEECYGIAPADFATIYNVPTTLTGAGVNIAIVQDSNINITDIQQFRNLFGLSNNFTASNIIFNGPDPGIQGPDSETFDEGEAVLDVEWSGAVAQGATINLVVSESSQTLGAAGIDLSAVYIIDNNIAPILSESFGACEESLGTSGVAFYDELWEQASTEGITVLISAGDSGSDSCDDGSEFDFSTTGLGISGLASTPFNVAMGGTDFQNGTSPSIYWSTTGTATESAKSYIPEETWNSSCAATATSGSLGTCTATIINADSISELGIDLTGGSGGQSGFPGSPAINPKPAWQTGVAPSADTGRDIPDVSLFSAVNTSNNDFYITCEQDSPSQDGDCSLIGGQTPAISPVGGTSAAAPAFAGIMALIIQQQGGNTAGRQGNANYVLYQLFKKDVGNTTLVCPSTAANVSTPTCIFYDVVTGNNSVACEGDTPNCSNTSTAANEYGILVDPNTPSNPAFLAVAGYDKATGLGSVNVANLAKAWSSATFDSSTTTITTSPTGTITHGATVSFTVKVTSPSGTPTGNVSLIASPPGSAPTAIGVFDNTTTSTFALSGGIATITTNLLPGYVVGGTATPYPVVAQYAGDGTFGAGTSTPVDVTVGQEASATAISLVGSATATSVVYGSSYITRVDVVGTGTNSDSQECSTTAIPCPTGSISLTDNGSNLNDFQNTQTGVFSNTATLPNDLGFLEDQLVQLPGGTNSLVAKYSGDSSYTASTSPALVVTVTAAPTGASVTASATSTTTVTPVTLTALIATQSGGAGPTGTVTFLANGSSIGTASVVPTAAAGLNTTAPVAAFSTATLAHTFAAAGTYAISVSYATSDLNYASSSSSGTGNFSLTITQGQTTGSFAVSYTPASLTLSSATGASQSTTVTVTPSGGFTGLVAVSASTALPGVTCTPSPLNITETGATAVTGQLSCSVLATSTTLTASNETPDRILEAKTTPSHAGGGTRWWALSAGSGFAALFLLFLPGGRKRYRAALWLGFVCLLSSTLGCGGSGGSTTTPPPGLTATVTKLTASTGKVASGTAFTFSVAVTGGTPTGQVELFDNGNMIGTVATVSGGAATPTAPALAVGTHTISAHYLGDTTTAASQSGTLNLTVTGGTAVAITTSPVATPTAPALILTIN